MKGEQKVIITSNSETVNASLKDGQWKIISITPQHVGGAWAGRLTGDFCFLIEKQ